VLNDDCTYLISGCFVKSSIYACFVASKSLKFPPDLSNKFTSNPEEIPKPGILGGSKKIILAPGMFAAIPNNFFIIASVFCESSFRSDQSLSLMNPSPLLLPCPPNKLTPLITETPSTPGISLVLL